jgi:DNA modification methylase
MIMSGSKEEKFDHPAQKPIAVIEPAITNHHGDVYEPFSGSGTTLIAAERLGRRCYAMELDPRYAQITIERWSAFAGAKAEQR